MKLRMLAATVAAVGALSSIAPAWATNDALVPGTDFHATGQLPCTIDGAAAQCDFGVRRAGGGKASVVTTLPGGTVVTLEFSDGTVAVDGQAVATERDADDTLVTLAGGQVIRVPDVVILGD